MSHSNEQIRQFFIRTVGASLAVQIVLAVSHHILLQTHEHLLRELLSVGLFAGGFLWARRGTLNPKYGNSFIYVCGMLSFGLVLAEERSVGNGQFVDYLQAMYVGAGIVILSLGWLSFFYASTLLIILTQSDYATLSTEQLPFLFVSLLLGYSCHYLQVRHTGSRLNLIAEEEARQMEFRETLHGSQLEKEKMLLRIMQLEKSRDQLKEDVEILKDEKSSLEQELLHSQAVDSIGRLAGGLAHELNNALTVISGNLELNREEICCNPDGPEILQELEESLERGTQLAGRLANVGGTFTLNSEHITVSELVMSLKKMLGSHRTARVNFDIPRECEDVGMEADVGAWLQVLQNLVVNALDAGGDELVTLSVQVSDETLSFLVKDRGHGVSEENQQKIFEPYFTTKARGVGTGLGLAIAAGVVEKHGGSLSLTETGPEGSTFCATIAVSGELPVSKKEKDMPQETITAGGTRVLFVEDEIAILKVTQRFLEKLGYDVTATSDPNKALSLLSEAPYDVVVSDVVMPGLDGPTMVAEARRQLPELKVIFVSGYTDDRLQGLDEESGRDGFLKKPYSIPELAGLIEKTVKAS